MDELYYLLKGLIGILFRCKFSLFNSLNECKDVAGSLRILGNGPSLRDNKFDGDDNFDYMSVNRFVLSDHYITIQPKYYVIADPFFYTNIDGIEIIKTIIAKTTWNIELWFPYSRRYENKISRLNSGKANIHFRFYNICDFNNINNCIAMWFYKHNLAMPKAQNVLVACVYIGIFKGYKKMELYGAEHSWLKNIFVNNNNEVCLYNPHFFDKGQVKSKTINEIQRANNYSLSMILYQYSKMFESYKLLQNISEKYDCRVINKTPNSYIDAFCRE